MSRIVRRQKGVFAKEKKMFFLMHGNHTEKLKNKRRIANLRGAFFFHIRLLCIK
jgi:hypothetical protein